MVGSLFFLKFQVWISFFSPGDSPELGSEGALQNNSEYLTFAQQWIFFCFLFTFVCKWNSKFSERGSQIIKENIKEVLSS